MPRRPKRIHTSRVRLPGGNEALISFGNRERRANMINDSKKVLRELIREFVREYSAKAPRRTGLMAEGFEGEAVERTWGTSFYKVTVHNPVWYSRLIEYGTEKHKQDRTVRRLKTRLKREGNEDLRRELL